MEKVKITQKLMDALNESISGKWTELSEGEGEDQGQDNCALCKTVNNDCSSCPVVMVLGKTKAGCQFEECINWGLHFMEYHRTNICRPLCCTCNSLAQKVKDKLIDVRDRCEVERGGPFARVEQDLKQFSLIDQEDFDAYARVVKNLSTIKDKINWFHYVLENELKKDVSDSGVLADVVGALKEVSQ